MGRVRFHVVSDVHGAAAALVGADAGADVFACTGDLALYLDYDDPTQGAFAEIFGTATAEQYVALRTEKRFADARALAARRWDEISGGADPAERFGAVVQVVERQYAEVFGAMPDSALITPGNVDLPTLWPQFTKPGHVVLDGHVAVRSGLRIGMVGGGLRSIYRTPNELDDAAFAAKVDALGPVDVLMSHVPPAVPELTYDIVARRHEVGSVALADYIARHRPRVAFFGHVHQPLARRTRIGMTECINVGHFRARRTPFVIDI